MKKNLHASSFIPHPSSLIPFPASHAGLTPRRSQRNRKMPQSIPELNQRLGIPGIAQVMPGQGGLPKVHIATSEVHADIYLHGAHVTSWQPHGRVEVLFVSSRSHWEEGKAIRGGIPICFPWFAGKADDPKAPAHGFVRTEPWQLESITRNLDSVTVCMATASNESTKHWWPADFRLLYLASFGTELNLELEFINKGDKPLRFEEALHTYLRVSRIEDIKTLGLDGVHYLDKTDGNCEKLQDGPIVITGETDRVYLNTTGPVTVEDRGRRRQIVVSKDNSRTTVVWNPWINKAKAMTDFGADEWQHMICVETSNVASCAVAVGPGETHTMKANIKAFDF
jgi:glucose-6-phosphate 1-epimerase